MKKVFALILSITMAATLFAGCSKKTETETTEIAAETTAVSEAAEEEPLSTATIEIADNSVAFAKNLKLGWNLGNTLDADGNDTLASETSWGQPRTTKELINYIKESGFTSIRIPVSWGDHTDADYNIDEEWMKRVTEVVKYAYNSGLYIIINAHHDCDFYYPTEEKYENSEKYIKAIWAQIAENFKDYDERLVFESMNEPRLMNTNKEWWFNANDEEGVASIKCIVKLNQAFVDTIRANGQGYNSTRYLMVPSNAASPDNALNNAFEMPTDPSERLILSVHAYTPYDFAMNENGYSTWDGSHSNDLGFMDRLDSKFIQKGYGVVIGEFGATNKDNIDDRIEWAKDYTGKAAELGIPCFLWDNGGIGVGTENFGMINRTALGVYFPELLDAMVKSYE